MEKKTFEGKLEIKFATSDTGTTTKSFSGYGAYFNNVDRGGDIIAPGAFSKSLADHKAAGTMPQMFFNHEAFSMPIGVWRAMEEDAKGLLVEGELIDTTSGRDTYAALKAGAVKGLSIGFRCSAFEIHNNIRTITEASLMEVSVVTFPMNEAATVTDVKSDKEDSKMTDDDLKSALAEAGFAYDEVVKLFSSRDDTKFDEETSDADEEENSETKYDEAAVVAAIKQLVATTKEIHVR